MFAIFGLTVALLFRNGEPIVNIFSNYYLIGQLIVYLLTLLIAILAMTLSPLDEIKEENEAPDEQAPLTAQQREDRIQQILDNDIDPRV